MCVCGGVRGSCKGLTTAPARPHAHIAHHAPRALVLGGQLRGHAAMTVRKLEEVASQTLCRVEAGGINCRVFEYERVVLGAHVGRGDRDGALSNERGLAKRAPTDSRRVSQ